MLRIALMRGRPVRRVRIVFAMVIARNHVRRSIGLRVCKISMPVFQAAKRILQGRS